ncbi:MAG: hypothetical protein AB4290_24835 [Spirulina sp.]
MMIFGKPVLCGFSAMMTSDREGGKVVFSTVEFCQLELPRLYRKAV